MCLFGNLESIFCRQNHSLLRAALKKVRANEPDFFFEISPQCTVQQDAKAISGERFKLIFIEFIFASTETNDTLEESPNIQQ